ncbi:hypothetical protein [Mycobacterium deserti]|uniref:Flavodoxin-like domain-containing protein n=1 Tax=Mycobacterium deserti TaxID=2978347 RepID=A0ABT2MJB5_9MYCO|nr:hypothetical protein [Mycobacterium deserti]MCT7661185.1 hypothetical protein [Mycobacterium deserti]
MKITAASAAETSRQSNRGHAAPYKLVVLASDTTDAVSAAGGLIADTLRVGWHVEVYLETGKYLETESDARALQILGVEGRLLPTSFDFELQWPDAVVFAAPIYHRHRGVRRFTADATRRHGADVAAWGGTWPTAAASASDIEHRVSCAAQAFKYHAMKAVNATAPPSPVESFHGGFHRLAVAAPPAPC